MSESLDRLAAAAISAAVVAFVALEGAAMHLYPGGTWWDATTRGHRFWENYLCDLEWEIALNHAPNRVGARLAVAAILVLDAGVAVFWVAVARVIAAGGPAGGATARAARRTVPTLGLVSAAATVGAALLPSEHFGALHGAFVLVAGAPGLAASLLAVAGLVAAEPRPKIAAWLGAATMIAATVDYALYATHFVAGANGTPLLPTAEKIALAFLLAWMIAVAVRVGRGRSVS